MCQDEAITYAQLFSVVSVVTLVCEYGPGCQFEDCTALGRQVRASVSASEFLAPSPPPRQQSWRNLEEVFLFKCCPGEGCGGGGRGL